MGRSRCNASTGYWSGARTAHRSDKRAWPVAAAHSRTPSGHPEGYLEGFANIYRNAAAAIAAKITGESVDPSLDFPTVEDGAIGVHFIHKAVESGEKRAWVDASYSPPS